MLGDHAMDICYRHIGYNPLVYTVYVARVLDFFFHVIMFILLSPYNHFPCNKQIHGFCDILFGEELLVIFVPLIRMPNNFLCTKLLKITKLLTIDNTVQLYGLILGHIWSW